jgi:hypothetical protein
MTSRPRYRATEHRKIVSIRPSGIIVTHRFSAFFSTVVDPWRTTFPMRWTVCRDRVRNGDWVVIDGVVSSDGRRIIAPEIWRGSGRGHWSQSP